MDSLTKAAFVTVGLIVLGAVWWYVSDELRQRRRERADLWARQQMSADEAPKASPNDDTAPLEPWPIDEDDPPELLRPYIWGHGDTEVIPRVQDLGPEPPDS